MAEDAGPLDLPLEELQLPARMLANLRQAGFTATAALVASPDAPVLKALNWNRKDLFDLRERLERYGGRTVRAEVKKEAPDLDFINPPYKDVPAVLLRIAMSASMKLNHIWNTPAHVLYGLLTHPEVQWWLDEQDLGDIAARLEPQLTQFVQSDALTKAYPYVTEKTRAQIELLASQRGDKTMVSNIEDVHVMIGRIHKTSDLRKPAPKIWFSGLRILVERDKVCRSLMQQAGVDVQGFVRSLPR